MSLSPGITVRPMWPQDVPFVTAYWLTSVRQSAGSLHDVHRYNSRHAALIKVLVKCSPACFVACSDVDPNMLYGFVVAGVCGTDEPVVHFVACKFLFRRMGVATALAEAALQKLNDDLSTYQRVSPGNARLTVSHRGLFGTKDSPTPYDRLSRKYRLAYDPHALLLETSE